MREAFYEELDVDTQQELNWIVKGRRQPLKV